MTALQALRQLIDSDSYLRRIRPSNPLYESVTFNTVEDGADVSQGDLFVIAHQGEDFSYTTETQRRTLTFQVMVYSINFVRLDDLVVPHLIDVLEDNEQLLPQALGDSYNLEILSLLLGEEDTLDRHGNVVCSATFTCKLEYQTPRKNSGLYS